MKSIATLLADWRASQAKMTLVEKNLPRMIGSEAVRIVKDNFRIQGYDSGNGVIPWPARKANTNERYDDRKGVKGSVFNSSNAILMQTQNLYDAVHYTVNGDKTVTIGVNLTLIPYAEIHNAGGMGLAWGKSPFRMPKRQYMPLPGDPPNPKIKRAVKEKLDYEIAQAMKTFIK